MGRSADHAEPQDVTHEVRSVDADLSVRSLHLRTVFPDFLELAPHAASQYACANVLESVPGGAAVIPWQDVKLDVLAERFADERTLVEPRGYSHNRRRVFRFAIPPRTKSIMYSRHLQKGTTSNLNSRQRARPASK